MAVFVGEFLMEDLKRILKCKLIALQAGLRYFLFFWLNRQKKKD